MAVTVDPHPSPLYGRGAAMNVARVLAPPWLILLACWAAMAGASEGNYCNDVRQFVYCERGLQEDLSGWTPADVLVANAVILSVREHVGALRAGSRAPRVDVVYRYALSKDKRRPAILFMTRGLRPDATEEFVDALYVVEVFGARELLRVVHGDGAIRDVIAREAVQSRLRAIATALHQRQAGG